MPTQLMETPTMRRILASCLLLGHALPCQAQGDKPKPNTLTAKEIADGWILLFDGETTFGWDAEGKVAVAKGALLVPGRGASISYRGAWGANDLRFEYRVPMPP